MNFAHCDTGEKYITLHDCVAEPHAYFEDAGLSLITDFGSRPTTPKEPIRFFKNRFSDFKALCAMRALFRNTSGLRNRRLRRLRCQFSMR